MYIYIILVILILILGKRIKKNQYNIYDFILIAFMILISGLRYGIGTDYAMYNSMYFNQNQSNTAKVEIGYKILMKLAAPIFGAKSYLFFLLCATITVIPIYTTIKKYSNKPGESIFYFVTLGFYTLSFNMVRQSIAMAITFFALRYLFDRKLLKYMITILVASTFHITSLIMIPMYWISKIKFSQIANFGIVLLLLFSGIMFNAIFGYVTTKIPQYAMYAKYDNTIAGIGTYLVNITYIALIVFAVINRKKIEQRNSNYFYIINMIIYSIFFIALSIKSTLFARLIYYWFMPIVIVIPEYILCIIGNKRNTVQFVMVLAFCLFYFLNIYSFNGVYPYTSIFN